MSFKNPNHALTRLWCAYRTAQVISRLSYAPTQTPISHLLAQQGVEGSQSLFFSGICDSNHIPHVSFGWNWRKKGICSSFLRCVRRWQHQHHLWPPTSRSSNPQSSLCCVQTCGQNSVLSLHLTLWRVSCVNQPCCETLCPSCVRPFLTNSSRRRVSCNLPALCVKWYSLQTKN